MTRQNRSRLLFLICLIALHVFTTVSFAAPPTPTGLWAYPSTSSQIYVAWDEVPSATNYTLQWKQEPQASWNQIGGYPYDSYQHLDLKCNTTYSYRVAAVSLSSGVSAFSSSVSATTLACPPGPKTTQLLYNGDFEINVDGNPKLPDGWTAKGPMLGDKLVGKNFGDGYYVSTGQKAMLFQTFPLITNNDRLYQGIDISGIDFNEGDELELTASIRHVKGAADNKVIWVTVAYADGSKADIKVATFKQGGYFHHIDTLVLERSDVAAIAVRLAYNKPNGKLALDNLSLELVQDASLTMVGADSTHLVPVPPAPADLRGSN